MEEQAIEHEIDDGLVHYEDMTRRRVIRLVLLLVAGAIVNVAVAWGCVLWSQASPNPTRLNIYGWSGSVPKQWPSHPGMKAAFDGFGYEEDLAIWSPMNLQSGTHYWQLSERAGWPLLTLALVRNVSHTGNSLPGGPAIARRHSLGDGLAVPEWVPFHKAPDWRSLPANMIWPGFAINTIFYAAILCVVFAVPLALRRRRRIKRGLCPACAYPIGTSPVCTECGIAIRGDHKQHEHSR